MAARELPPKPSLEHLRKEAKSLLAEWSHGNDVAKARVAQSHPECADGKRTAPQTMQLADAQLVVAREYGFSTWAKLKRFVEMANPDANEMLRLFVLAASAEHNDGHAEKLLAAHPELASGSFWAMLVSGNEDGVAAELEEDAALATTKGGPREWEPIQYLCQSRFEPNSPEMDARKARIARALFANGANANSAILPDEGSTFPSQPILYGATGINNFPKLARALLEAGANPTDCESVYHAAQHAHIACLEVLVEFGSDLSGRREPWDNTPLYFLMGQDPGDGAIYKTAMTGVKWLLEHGADPNVWSYACRETGMHRIGGGGHGVDILELFIAHGAEVSPRNSDNRTPYSLALALGRTDIAEALLRHGAKPDEAGPAEQFAGACSRADEAEARALLAKYPQLAPLIRMVGTHILHVAARRDNAAAVEVMSGLGFDIAARGEAGGTALHQAAWRGCANAVRSLIKLGAPIDVCCETYKATPLGWATHGSTNSGRGGDFMGCVVALLDAGADISAPNGWGEPPIAFATPEIRKVLQDRGALM